MLNDKLDGSISFDELEVGMSIDYMSMGSIFKIIIIQKYENNPEEDYVKFNRSGKNPSDEVSWRLYRHQVYGDMMRVVKENI